jgi:hypothetical protein
MPPYYVRDLNDYYLWLEKQIEYSGASLVREPLEVQLVGEDPEERPELLLVQGRQALRWPDGLVLEFDLVVDANLHPTWYRYALFDRSGTFVWRIDKHAGHEATCRGEQTHIHRQPGGPPEYYPEVTFDEVIQKVHAEFH